ARGWMILPAAHQERTARRAAIAAIQVQERRETWSGSYLTLSRGMVALFSRRTLLSYRSGASVGIDHFRPGPVMFSSCREKESRTCSRINRALISAVAM